MQERFRDVEHLVRLVFLFILAIGCFAVVRAWLVPADFGKFGHYRAGALDDIRARPASFAGRSVCVDCHSDVEEARKGGAHAGIGCEACHGPLAAHAADPTSTPPVKPDAKALCPVCHEHNAAKPERFQQVDTKAHAEGASCVECHKAHAPKIS